MACNFRVHVSQRWKKLFLFARLLSFAGKFVTRKQCSSCVHWDFTQGERSVFYTRSCKKADKWSTRQWPGLFVQPSATAVMHCHPQGCTHPPPRLTLSLGQNLSSEQIAPNDNMRPKSDDAKRHHWLLINRVYGVLASNWWTYQEWTVGKKICLGYTCSLIQRPPLLILAPSHLRADGHPESGRQYATTINKNC